MFGLDAQLVIEIATFPSGTLEAVAGFDLIPLIDVMGILSNGEAELSWRGVSGSLGVAYRM